MTSTSPTLGLSPISTRRMRREKTEVTWSTTSAGPETLTTLPRTETMASKPSSIRLSSESAGPMSAVGSTESGMVRRTCVGSMFLLRRLRLR